MRASHMVTPVFDDPNLVSAAGLVPVMRLAESAGLHELVAELVATSSPNPVVKATGMVAGMLAGADSIDDLDVLRHGGMGRLFGGVRAPSTFGTYLRSFTHGHVQQLDAVSARFLAGLAERVPGLIAGGDQVDGIAFVDVDDTIRQVHGHAKQGAAFGYSGVRGLNAQLACVSTPLTAPVIAAARLRKGNTASGKGGGRLLAQAIGTARRAGVSGRILVRADSAYYSHAVVSAAVRAGAWFSVTARMNAQVTAAIASIPERAWTAIKYPNAVWEDDDQRWISDAEVAENHAHLLHLPPPTRPRHLPAGGPPGQAAQPPRTGRAGRAVHRIPASRVHHQLHPGHDRGRPATPRPRRGRAGHRRAQGRPPGAPAVGVLRRERRLARPRGDRVQPGPRRRSRRLAPARPRPLGHPADPADQRPRPDRVLGPTADPAPTHRLAMGRRLADHVRHRHRATGTSRHLTTHPAGTTKDSRGKAGHTGSYHQPTKNRNSKITRTSTPKSASVDQGSTSGTRRG